MHSMLSRKTDEGGVKSSATRANHAILRPACVWTLFLFQFIKIGVTSLTMMALLDPDELLAIRENLHAARSTADGPPARVVPESLCQEVETLLQLVEAECRRFGEQGSE